MTNDTFDILFLIARPAAGKSEIIDYLKRSDEVERRRRFHIGAFDEIDDFPMLWTWFDEDAILARMGKPRLHSDADGYFLHDYLWHMLVERMALDYGKLLRETPDYHGARTTIVEFARGAQHGGWQTAFPHFPAEMLRRGAILYINVSWEESLRKNRRRFNPERPDSILEHALPDEKMERLYRDSDWIAFTAGDPQFVSINDVPVPYVVFENEDDVTTERGSTLGERLEETLARLWELRTAVQRSGNAMTSYCAIHNMSSPINHRRTMSESLITDIPLEVHSPEILAQARTMLDACRSGRDMQDVVIAAVKRNEKWRGEQCINLLAPEAPTSPTVRALLSAEVGTRAAEGHIGKVNRWFAGTKYIDEIEALCVELLKQAFRARYADHRLVASMVGNLAVFTALTEPGDVIMSIAQPFGGHSSNRVDGPAGVRGLKIVDVPMDPDELVVDLDAFRALAPLVRPKLVALGASMTLFPFPLQEMSEVMAEWGGKLFFDGAHQIGLIAGGQFQDPLPEGAAVMTGSAGKTFSGPQSGIIVWNDPSLTQPLTHAIFPVLAATHQVNRVAALAVAAAEMIEFGQTYMAQIVRNAQALGAALEKRGIPVLGARKGYTRTHQVIADVRAFGNGLETAHLLARANIVTNKNLIPGDSAQDWDRPSGLRMGAIEVTRYGMHENEMDTIADFMARVLVERESPETVVEDVIEFRQDYQTLFYNFDHGLPLG